MAALKGDILLLGVGGKMGPALARLAKEAVERAGIKKRIIGVSRFSEEGLQEELHALGIETHKADLLQDNQLEALPEAENVLYMAGTKFGTTGNESLTWAMNAYLPGRVAQKYKSSRIVVFSTGNVYPLVPVFSGGADEKTSPNPVGEYAQSCLGRERLFQYYASKHHTSVLIYRLNYANDVTYGVLLEIARAVKEQRPVDLSMGHVNVIWQGDANEIALRALHHCSVPAKILNVTGPETLSVRWLAQEFGQRFGKTPEFINEEQPTALLSNAAEVFRLFGYPSVTTKQMIELIAQWISEGGKIINKPTHFQERAGQF
jgi:dTDP-4-dehydrorhamnose reductase